MNVGKRSVPIQLAPGCHDPDSDFSSMAASREFISIGVALTKVRFTLSSPASFQHCGYVTDFSTFFHNLHPPGRKCSGRKNLQRQHDKRQVF